MQMIMLSEQEWNHELRSHEMKYKTYEQYVQYIQDTMRFQPEDLVWTIGGNKLQKWDADYTKPKNPHIWLPPTNAQVALYEDGMTMPTDKDFEHIMGAVEEKPAVTDDRREYLLGLRTALVDSIIKIWVLRALGEEVNIDCHVCAYRLKVNVGNPVNKCTNNIPNQCVPWNGLKCCDEFYTWNHDRTPENALLVTKRLNGEVMKIDEELGVKIGDRNVYAYQLTPIEAEVLKVGDVVMVDKSPGLWKIDSIDDGHTQMTDKTGLHHRSGVGINRLTLASEAKTAEFYTVTVNGVRVRIFRHNNCYRVVRERTTTPQAMTWFEIRLIKHFSLSVLTVDSVEKMVPPEEVESNGY